MIYVVYALQEHYWTHVEFFPYRPIAEPARQEFVACLRHGQLGMSSAGNKWADIDLVRSDQMTSLSSTFPYTADQCEKFLKLVAVSGRETGSASQTIFSLIFLSEQEAKNPHMTCVAARLMGNISKSRFT